MRPVRTTFRARQARHAFIVTLLIAVTLGFTAYLRARPEQVDVKVDGETVSVSYEEAYSRYQSMDRKGYAALTTESGSFTGKRVGVRFCGLAKENVMRALYARLNESGQSTVFYISEKELDQNAALLSQMVQWGCPLGIWLNRSVYSPDAALVQLTSETLRLRENVAAGVQSALYSGSSSIDMLRGCLAASGLEELVVPALEWNPNAGGISAEKIVASMARGELLCLTLSEDTTLDALNAVLDALDATDLTTRASALLQANAGAQAEETARLYTTERAVCFTFSDLSDEQDVRGVLSALKTMDAKGYFYVTTDELREKPELVREIVGAGHDVGYACVGAKHTSALDIAVDALLARELLEDVYGVRQSMLGRQAFGSINADMLEAFSACDVQFVSGMMNAVKNSHLRLTDTDEIMRALFTSEYYVLQRGAIVYFHMGQYMYSHTLTGELARAIGMDMNIYALRSVRDVMTNEAYVYTYPLPAESIRSELRDVIYPGQLSGDLLTEMKTRYIGNHDYGNTAHMPGFSRAEISQLNNAGLVHPEQKVVFLTFDDWGHDGTLTRLLDVLAKHNAKGTFFVRTNNVESNPNLLRAIAAEGHTVASHTHSHVPLSNEIDAENRAEALTQAQEEVLRADVVQSWQDLQYVIGDMLGSDGYTPLQPFFRQPTLAVSKNGVGIVLDCGFAYVIAGSTSTHDYQAESAQALYTLLKKATVPGAVLIMHMSDNSVYTAEALDQYLTAIEESGAGYTFPSLGEALGIKQW